jgi:hypothetical protein
MDGILRDERVTREINKTFTMWKNTTITKENIVLYGSEVWQFKKNTNNKLIQC